MLVALVTTSGAHAQASSSRDWIARFTPYQFITSQGDTVPVEMGTLRVPEVRRDPQSRNITLSFIRLRSTAATPGAPIFYLDGGPGNSGIQNARSNRGPMLLAMRAVADVIIPDYRGIGLSANGLDCTAVFAAPLDRPLTYAARLESIMAASRRCVDEMHGKGVDLRGYTLLEGADDIDDIRRSIGARKISLIGLSFGTTHGLTVIRRHEARVYRAVLAGLEGVDDALKLPSRIDVVLAYADSLARADTAVGQYVPGLIEPIREILSRLERQPVTVRIKHPQSGDSVTVVLGPYDFQWAAWSLFASDGLAVLPGVLHQVLGGDYHLIAQFVATRERTESLNAMVFHTDCASGASSARERRVLSEERRFIFGSQPRIYYQDVCPAWGSPDLGSAFRRAVYSRVPTLFISGSLDARTPPAQAEITRRGFRNSAHLIVEGAVHSTPLFLSSPDIVPAMINLLRDGRLADRRVSANFAFRPIRGFHVP